MHGASRTVRGTSSGTAVDVRQKLKSRTLSIASSFLKKTKRQPGQFLINVSKVQKVCVVGTFLCQDDSLVGQSCTPEKLVAKWQASTRLGSQFLAIDFMESVLLTWKVMCGSQSVANLLLAAEERFGVGGPFDSPSRIKAIVRRAKRDASSILFILQHMLDQILNTGVEVSYFSMSRLTGTDKKSNGLLDEILLKHQFLKQFLGDTLECAGYSLQL